VYPIILDYEYSFGQNLSGDCKNGRHVATREEFRIDGLNEPISHYTDAVRFGNLLFVSGVAPLDDAGKVVSSDVVAQAKQVFINLKKVLRAADADFGDVLKVTVFLTEVADRAKINPVRQQFFGKAKPASTLIGVKSLAVDGMKIEIEAVVGLKGERG
jgi:2-iminobutanoate/2-iminopropanoate deaminase